jgi:hypothetical protein
MLLFMTEFIHKAIHSAARLFHFKTSEDFRNAAMFF